jgi:signal transduction histidine kinase
LGLDWPLPQHAPRNALSGLQLPAWFPALWGLLPAGVAAVLGVLVLRRQRRLTSEFVETAELAARSTQELAAEKEVSELKTRFVNTVSHEFRTPLGITMSAIELMRHYDDKLPQEEKRQLYDDIFFATKNMAGLMEQVLLLGRVDAGKLAFNPILLDIDALMRKLTDESLSATKHKCEIEWHMENDLIGANADESLIRHIFSNLLNNAVKYSPEGSVVKFSARREGPMLVFTVRDKGIGIPEQDIPHIFEAFHRASNVGEISGTGLGLVIIKRCVDLHRGSIQLNSMPGEGTTVIVRLPAW